MMEMAVDQLVHVSTVWHRLVPAAWTVLVRSRVPAAAMAGGYTNRDSPGRPRSSDPRRDCPPGAGGVRQVDATVFAPASCPTWTKACRRNASSSSAVTGLARPGAHRVGLRHGCRA